MCIILFYFILSIFPFFNLFIYLFIYSHLFSNCVTLGSCDPILKVECLGQKYKKVAPEKAVTHCIFDELFVFSFKSLDPTALSEGLIRLSVNDCRTTIFDPTRLLGEFEVEAGHVYQSGDDHEWYKQWVPLTLGGHTADVCVRGFLLVSIQVVGPGDKTKIHNESREEKLRADIKLPADVGK